jgi:hypothetical protein
VKLSLCLTNESSRHEEGWESGRIAPPLLTSALDVVTGLLKARPLHAREKKFPVSIGEDSGWAKVPVWTL